MSGGHGSSRELGVSNQILERILNNPQVQERIYRLREIITTYDMPYVGGYSKNGNHIYLDRHLPEELTLERDGTKKVVRPVIFLADTMGHEPVEWSVMDAMGMDYGQAHQIATGAERRKVLMYLGPGWWPVWQKAIEGYVKADAHEKIKKVPRDYDFRPMQYENDTALIAHMKKCIRKGKR